MAKLRFEIEGEPDNIQFHTYLTALVNAVSVLRELDAAISGKHRGTLNWYVSHLSKNKHWPLTSCRKLKPIKPQKNAPVVVDSSGGSVPEPLSVDLKIWNTERARLTCLN